MNSCPPFKTKLIRGFALTGLALALINNASGAQNPPKPIVDLRAEDVSAGSEIWANRGTLGDFKRLGNPKRTEIGKIAALSFDGLQDAYRGPVSIPALEGNAPRTIEVWAYNPSVDSDEETLVAWGERGGEAGSMVAFGWGKSGAYGGAVHWANDLGWNGPPSPKHWHYLVYSFDGKTVRIYDDAVEKNSRETTINTSPRSVVSIGVPNGNDGLPLFKNEYNRSPMAASLAISVVRIRSGALTQKEISAAFDLEARRYGASRADAEGLLAKGTSRFDAGNLSLSVMNATGTASALSPKGSDFDFTPGDRLRGRTSEGYYHLGDANLRIKMTGGDWKNFSTAKNRESRHALNSSFALCADDLTANLGAGCPVRVVREWSKENGKLVLRFKVSNPSGKAVEIGAFGAPMVFNNLLTGRSLEETHDKCSFSDPYVGGQAGYLQVTRLNGAGPVLLVLPQNETSFEAYRPLYDDPTSREVTFEGFYEWMSLTKAYEKNEWKRTQPWNEPTSRTLKPGETAVFGFQFLLAPSIHAIEQTLVEAGRQIAVGTPGYVIATDQKASLFISGKSAISEVRVSPQGSIKTAIVELSARRASAPATNWSEIALFGKTPGRARIEILTEDGKKQFVHYFVTAPEATQIRNLGKFHATKQWFDAPDAPFGRTFSFLPYDREKNEMVTQHSHTWFSGLSDEIGAGASVAMAMKNLGQPNAEEVALIEKYVKNVLWGKLQNKNYSVRASLFFYQPNLLPEGYYKVRGGWDRERGETTWRSFNYPHVACVYWAMYHLARDYRGLAKERTWDWYLDQAYRTSMAIKEFAPGYAEVGLMVGSVFPEIIRDLRREGWAEKAADLEGWMKTREKRWEGLRYPFGSEMPWDSTGQEEIYTWCRYFGAEDKAQATLSAILGYMPTLPNWAYNGAGRRYFDAPVNGTRWPDIVRMTNHYGSSINSIPVLDSFRSHPDDLYLLRVGYAGMNQIMANIDSEGFGSYGFDADPAILKFDPYTADYGIAFYGYARNAGCYVVDDKQFGWQAFGGEVERRETTITITPKDGFRKRVFLAPLKLWLTLESGTFEQVVFDSLSHSVAIRLSPETEFNPAARLRVVASGNLKFKPNENLPVEREAYVVPLGSASVTVRLNPGIEGEKE